MGCENLGCWLVNRQRQGAEMPPHLENIDNEQFNYWLSRFVVEVRNKNGEHYHSGTYLCWFAAIHSRKANER